MNQNRPKPMAFEAPLADLEDKIESLKALSEKGELNLADEIANIEARARELKKDIYSICHQRILFKLHGTQSVPILCI